MKIRRVVSLMTALIMVILLLSGCGGSSAGGNSEITAPQLESIKGIDSMDVTRIDFKRSTEAGSYQNSVYDEPTIADILNKLAEIKITAESDMAVGDNGLYIGIKTKNGETSLNFEGDILVLVDGSRYEVEGADSLEKYIDDLAILMKEGDAPTSSGGSTGTASGTYGILDGGEEKLDGSLSVLYCNGFTMVMPNNDKWSFHEADDHQSITFYLNSAKNEGYGGRLVTIYAYDPDDTSYQELPNYRDCGVSNSAGKRIIADFPTDVQWNHEDAQQEADYRELQEYLYKIGGGAVNSPVQVN